MTAPSFDDWLDLILLMESVRTVAEMGVEPIAYVRLWATCSGHGDFSRVYEVGEDIRVLICEQHDGLIHTSPVEAIQRATVWEAPR